MGQLSLALQRVLPTPFLLLSLEPIPTLQVLEPLGPPKNSSVVSERVFARHPNPCRYELAKKRSSFKRLPLRSQNTSGRFDKIGRSRRLHPIWPNTIQLPHQQTILVDSRTKRTSRFQEAFDLTQLGEQLFSTRQSFRD
jgi:hypothetical protein